MYKIFTHKFIYEPVCEMFENRYFVLFVCIYLHYFFYTYEFRIYLSSDHLCEINEQKLHTNSIKRKVIFISNVLDPIIPRFSSVITLMTTMRMPTQGIVLFSGHDKAHNRMLQSRSYHVILNSYSSKTVAWRF